jgi:hypothetical protein
MDAERAACHTENAGDARFCTVCHPQPAGQDAASNTLHGRTSAGRTIVAGGATGRLHFLRLEGLSDQASAISSQQFSDC